MTAFLYWILFSLQLILPLIAVGILLYVMYAIWTFRNPLPFVPTPLTAAKLMAEAAHITPMDRVMDLGSGTGRLVFLASRRHPALVVGVERRRLLYGIAQFRRWLGHRSESIQFQRGDLYQTDLRSITVVMGFWIPSEMDRLVKKFQSELRSGSRVVSYLFPVPFDKHWSETVIPTNRKRYEIYLYQRRS